MKNVQFTCDLLASVRHAPSFGRAQRGASLFVAIVALAMMTVAGLSLMRSVDTANIIAGNMAFKNSTVNAADLGLEAAAAYLHNTIAVAPNNLNLPAGCTVGTAAAVGPPATPATLGDCIYSARYQPEDTFGVPLIKWSSNNIPVSTINGNAVQFVVERMCSSAATDVVSLKAPAFYEDASRVCAAGLLEPKLRGSTQVGGSAKVGSGPPLTPPTGLMYRVTVRVVGPRNTISTVQAIMLR